MHEALAIYFSFFQKPSEQLRINLEEWQSL